MKEIGRYHFCDTTIIYISQSEGKNVEWILVPDEKERQVVLPQRQKYDSLVQLKLAGDDYPKGFVTGHTMRNSQTVKELYYSHQEMDETNTRLKITTTLADKRNHEVIHTAICDKETGVIETHCEFINHSNINAILEMFASVSLSALSPFAAENSVGNLFLNRFRSKWGMEGRLERQPIEYYQLEPSWKPSGVGLEKFGQVGSMPVRGFFPYLCIEDEVNQTAWAVQLATPGSWQLEVYRLDEDLCIAGGLADADFGQWKKAVQPKESFTTPSAFLTVCKGNQEIASQRLTNFHEHTRLARNNGSEADLPVQFNEFCTTWGKPTEEQIRKDIALLKDRGIGYYVIDAGWYADELVGWENNMGDWKVSRKQFPHGMAAAVEIIKDADMIPGIWFEWETVGRTASVFKYTNQLLKKDGFPITVGDRRFWDVRQPEVQAYLKENVIEFLKQYDFGYLKVDYNDNFGVGIDHPDSLGEGNREQLASVQSFFKEIHRELPNLVIENCSSGGHRLEPSMMQLTDLSSFSDAHEVVSIPIIAANLQQLIHPAQSLIWAVIRKGDADKRLYYSMVSTFLGRMCLSGDIHALSGNQWQIIGQGLAFYKKIKTIIRDGKSYRYGREVLSYRHPEGNQAVVRYTSTEALVVAHHFENSQVIKIPLLAENWKIAASFGVDEQKIKLDAAADALSIQFNDSFQACALLLSKKDSPNIKWV